MLCIASKNLVNIWLLCFKNLIHERALSQEPCRMYRNPGSVGDKHFLLFKITSPGIHQRVHFPPY